MRLGYLMGIAVTVIVDQLPKLFGFSVDAENLIPGLREFVRSLDDTNETALVIGVASIMLILVPTGLFQGFPLSARTSSTPRSASRSPTT